MKMLIAANFKMNKTISNLKEYLSTFKWDYSCFVNIDLMIAPVTIWLWVASELLKDSCINLWAQNMHYEKSWAYTWEVSPLMLQDIWCNYVILWHSERREFFWETNAIVNKKISSAIEHKIRPILCIWENLWQKELWLTKEVLKIQLFECLDWIDYEEVDVAYEPVWAIWTWHSATKEYVEDIHNYLKTLINNDSTRIIYWWSVKPDNAKELIGLKNVNWFLVWSASLDPKNFLEIVEQCL